MTDDGTDMWLPGTTGRGQHRLDGTRGPLQTVNR